MRSRFVSPISLFIPVLRRSIFFFFFTSFRNFVFLFIIDSLRQWCFHSLAVRYNRRFVCWLTIAFKLSTQYRILNGIQMDWHDKVIWFRNGYFLFCFLLELFKAIVRWWLWLLLWYFKCRMTNEAILALEIYEILSMSLNFGIELTNQNNSDWILDADQWLSWQTLEIELMYSKCTHF